jgi:2-keto-3-deoxy-L-rhamnonate aldolase RhmA
MKRIHAWALATAALVTGLSIGASAVFGQATEDAVATGGQFPLAAPAGVDSQAIRRAPANAVNTGDFNDRTWKYGPATDVAGGVQIWNPAMVKLKAGGKVTGGTAFYVTDPEVYCAMANAGYDFIWTEHQHSPRDWYTTARMWNACPHARAVPGVRVAYTDEREEQHALDAGALVLVIPTVRSVAEGTLARNWAMFPPLGHRSNGGGQAFSMWANVPGGYRNTANDNIVLIEMIETLDGLKDADQIARIPGVSALFAASGDLGNFSGFRQGSPDYERAINIVHDATLKAHIRLCGPLAWRDRPDFTCFQAGSETGLIGAGARAELGALANTQGVPTAGPYGPGGDAYVAPGSGRGGRGGGRGGAPAGRGGRGQ